MHLKPRDWFLISLLLFAGAVCTWQYAEKRAALRNHAPTAQVSALPPHQPAATNTAAAKPINKHKSYRISNTTQTVAQLLRNNHAIILRNALIDTEVPVGLDIPAHLRAKGAPGSYLVQANRPLDKAFYAEISKTGASYIPYIPNNAALVQATPAQATNLAANADVIVVLPYQPYYKLDATLLPSAVEQQIQTNVLNVTTFPGQRDAVLAALTQLGAKLLGEDSGPFGPTLTVRVPPQNLVAVAQLPLAQEIEAYSPRHLLNDLTRQRMGESTNTLLGTPTYLGLSGLNVTVNINDSGVDGTHPDLMGRLMFDTNNPGLFIDSSSSHGTHVAGIIAGSGLESTTVTYPIPGSSNNADFRGKATNATLFVQSYNSTDAYLQTNASTNLGPTNLISNNSWGYASTVYDTHAASYDAATRDALPNSPHGGQPLLFVFAAGDGNNDGVNASGTITSPGTAKNVITVGVIDSPRNITNKVTYDGNLADGTEIWLGETDNSNTVNGYSSSGNVDIGVEGLYGRFKPDVVAPGVFTISCRATNYVDPTNEPQITDYGSPNQTVSSGETNIYFLNLPDDTSQVILVISSNLMSPAPFPTNMLILGDLTYPPTNILSTNNYYVLTNFSPGDFWIFGVAAPTNQSATQATVINYNFDMYLYETNDIYTNYYAVLSNLNNPLKPYYMYQSGTSMAAGAVSGTLALMQEFLQRRLSISNPSPALLKAMLINGSRTLSSSYDFNVTPMGTANAQGWGLPNITNCLPASLTNANPSMMVIDQSTNNALATGQYQTYTITCTDSNAISNAVRITLVWTDPPGNPAAGIALVNNLDLTVADSTGTNIFIGNNFLSGDVFTVASNPTNLPANQSSNTVQNIYVTNGGVATFTSAGDPINNVQNVYISSTNGPNKTINFPLTVTISGTRINVNAVTTQTTNIMQDYALVISSDRQTLSNALTITTNPIVSLAPLLMTTVNSGVPLLHQRVGANEPNLYSYPTSTNGASNQWHFFVFTNNQSTNGVIASYVAFATFLPPNLSIPRNTGADIDLYVNTNGNNPLTSFPLFMMNAITVHPAVTTGNESIVLSNQPPSLVYYIGVKSEDQQGADFGFYAIAQQEPFSSQNSDGSITATGNTTPPILIPDATSPQPALAFAFMVNPNPLEPNIRRTTVTLGITQPNPYDLYGTVQFSGLYTTLNAYDSSATNYIYNVYDDLQEDPNSGDVVTDGLSEGRGGLTQYAGLNANGLWLLTEADRAIGQVGYITNFSVTVDPQPPQLGGFIISNLCGGEWYDSYIDVPNDATNLTITATFIGGAGNIAIYLTNYDNLSTSDYGSNNNAPNGVIVTLGTNNPVPGWPSAPPLSGGRWYYGIYNLDAANTNDCLTLAITNYIQESLTPNLTQTYTNNTITPLTTDGHIQSEICLTNVAAGTQVVSLQIGVLIADTNLDDLVIHLISPQGTEVNLFEDRGGPTATNLGLIQTNGGYIYTIFTENTNLATTPIKFAPPSFAYMSVVPTNLLWSDSFETSSNGVYTNGQFVGNGWFVTNDEVPIMTTNGPTLQTNDEVGIVTDPNGEQYVVTNVVGVTTNVVTNSLGTNYLALTSGHIIQTFGVTNTFGITNGQPYQIVFYAKPMGITDWWPADDDTDDIINSTNDGIATFSYFTPFGVQSSPTVTYDVGEVGRAFTFDGTTNVVTFGTNVAAFGTNDFTIDFWMKTTLATNTFVTLLEKGTGNNFESNYVGILLRGSNIYYLQSSNNISSHVFELSSTNSVNITNGVYHHLAVTRQSLATNISVISIYIDGTNITAGTNTEDSVISNTTPLVAGYDSTFLPYAGNLDELDLFNRALSPAEVYAIFYAGSNGKYNTNSLLPNFQLTIDGIATNTVTLTNWSGGWELITNSFTANSDQITVEFSGNTMGVLLDDIQLVQEPATNYNNYFLPEEPLTPFVGENPLGCWTLDVWDTRNDSPLPTNGTLVSWNLQVTTSSTNATLYVLATNGYTLSITNAQSNGMTYFAVDVPSYATYATNILTVSNVAGAGPYTIYFDQTNLPTGGLPGDVVLTNGITFATGPSTNVLASLGSPPPLLPGQRYFLGVLNTGGTIGAFNITVNFNVAATNGITTLSNTIPTNNSIIIGTNGASTPEYYVFVVPTNAVLVTFQILNATNGEVDLYAHDGLPLPGPSDFDYASRNTSTNDQFITVTTTSVPVALPVASTNDAVPLTPSIWYLAAYNEITNITTNTAPVTNNYTIVATYVTNGQLTIIPLTNGVPFNTPASGLPYFTNAAPGYPTNVLFSYTDTNLTNAALQFTVTNLSGVGNVELLAGLDVIPTPQDFYIGSFNSGTNAQLIQLLGTNAAVTNAISGTWYLVVPNTSDTNVSYSIEALEIGTGSYTTNSPAIFSAAVAPATGKFTMSWSANPGQTYEVDMSTNLPNWIFLTNVTAQSTTATYTDPTPVSSQSLRFYRLH